MTINLCSHLSTLSKRLSLHCLPTSELKSIKIKNKKNVTIKVSPQVIYTLLLFTILYLSTSTQSIISFSIVQLTSTLLSVINKITVISYYILHTCKIKRYVHSSLVFVVVTVLIQCQLDALKIFFISIISLELQYFYQYHCL